MYYELLVCIILACVVTGSVSKNLPKRANQTRAQEEAQAQET